MVITNADKSTHDLVMMCKNLYKELLHRELNSGAVYQPLQRPVDEVYEQHARLAQLVGQVPVNKAAHGYGVVKMHKTPLAMRWIAGATMVNITKRKKIPSTSIGQSAAALGGMLREVPKKLQEKDVRLYQRTGVWRFWIVTSTEQVAQQIRQLSADTQGQLWTRDFTAMYTSLP